MSDIAIRIDNLSKKYRIGRSLQRPDMLRDALAAGLRRSAQRLSSASRRPSSDGHARTADDDHIWALKDVSFQVPRGQVVGVIGRNGAGKTTLLKILSRITEPTEGRAEIHGRVGSLLEVGTGFHPELTGRENIYLSGAILGMRRAEIEQRFDEIVAFSGIGKFIDTPIKRYSSGMNVRLGFSVAAHLEPEILLVDEVLAVGDAAFQQKCLGKMQEVVEGGRTILFVSHNMDAILSLCHQVVVIQNGRNSSPMQPEDGVRRYLQQPHASVVGNLEGRERLQHKPRSPIFIGLEIQNETNTGNIIPAGGGAEFKIEMRDFGDLKDFECTIAITNERAQRVVVFHTRYHNNLSLQGSSQAQLTCWVPSMPFVPGKYFVDLVVASQMQIIERIERAGQFRIVFADLLGTGQLPSAHQGHVVLPCQWNYAPR